MRIYVFGATLSMSAFLCGCGMLALYFEADGCNGTPAHCPASTVSESGGQCTYTYYTAITNEGGICVKHTNTVPLRCVGDTSTPTGAAAAPSGAAQVLPHAASSNPYVANQMQTFLASLSGPAPFDIKQIILDLPFAPTLPVRTDPVNCDPSVTVISVGYNRGTVQPISPCTDTVGTAIPTGAGSLQIAITPDAKFAFVTNLNGSIPVIDLASRSVVTTIPTPGAKPFGIAISPDGATAYVTSFDSTNPALLTVDVARRAVTSTVKLAALPQNVFVSPDGNLIWITSQIPDIITVLDALTLTPVASISGVTSPTGMAFNPTATIAYVASATTPGTVKAIDTTSYSIVKSYNVGSNPVDVRIGNGAYAAVLNRGSDFISQINLQTGQVTSEPANLVPNVVHAGLALIQ
jgi:YVTN family beta-propeller protein